MKTSAVLVRTLIVACAILCLPVCKASAGENAGKLPSKDKFKIVLLAGQSNMAGRGFIEDEDRVPIPRVFMLDRNGEWVPAVDPVHYDKPSAGVGPGREFARLLAESDPEIAVGLVPAACGGSSIDHWTPGTWFGQTKSHPYDDAVSRTKRALEDGELTAILWRQGESDLAPEKTAVHQEKLEALFKRLRKDLNAPETPILVGELKIVDKKSEDGARAIREAQIATVENSQPAAFVSAEGAVLNPDRIHFDRASQLEQGRRFYDALIKLRKTDQKE